MSRADRVGELLRDEISGILRKKINDPRIGFVSITRVDVTDDLKHARVYVSIFEDEEKKKTTMKGLESAKRFIMNMIAPSLDLKFLPEITFKQDNSIENASRVFEIMHRIKEKGREK